MDFKQMKMVNLVWPKRLPARPSALRVWLSRVGQWPARVAGLHPPTTRQMRCGSTRSVNENLPGCGKAVSDREFLSTTGEYWRLDGYSMNIEVIGPY